MCPVVYCFERLPHDLSEQATSEEVAFAGHPSGGVGVEVVVLDALKYLLLPPLDSLGAWCEDNIVLFDGDVYSLDLVGSGGRLSFGWIHVVTPLQSSNALKPESEYWVISVLP